MKCEKCNEKQANFYYSCVINGEKTEKHLCADCAREEGLCGCFDQSPTVMFEDFFAPVGYRLPSFAGFGSPFGSIMGSAFPSLRPAAAPAKAPVEEPAEEKSIPEDAGREIRLRREREALKAQLLDAVKAEDYEQAIILRDKLRETEK